MPKGRGMLGPGVVWVVVWEVEVVVVGVAVPEFAGRGLVDMV